MDDLYKLNDFLEQKVKDDIIKETTYLDIQKYLKNVSTTISSLKAQVELLDNDTQLNLIEYCLKEATDELEEFDTANSYLTIAKDQLRKLRDPY